ncbi:MAG: hypothetical protein IPN59_04840 [Holophaga sp.]|nr:hypothetical protein [Holophaga sp.]
MKRPVWKLELIRDTNAPLEAVVRVLADGKSFHRWHPRLSSVEAQVTRNEPDRFEMAYTSRPWVGVEEHGVFTVAPNEGRLLLTHRATFKGWPVLILMGWWRLRSHRMWESLVRSL